MTTRSADAYLRTQILTAPPEKLQLLLYDGAIRFATQGRRKLVEGDYESSCLFLVKAQNIVLELLCGLRPEHDAALCGRMAALYSFIYHKLLDANVNRSPEAVDDALKILSIQRRTWLELLEKLSQEHSREHTEVPVNA